MLVDETCKREQELRSGSMFPARSRRGGGGDGRGRGQPVVSDFGPDSVSRAKSGCAINFQGLAALGLSDRLARPGNVKESKLPPIRISALRICRLEKWRKG